MVRSSQKSNTIKVPKLRFPGFKGEWEEKLLKEVGEILGGGTPSTKNRYFWNGNIPWVSSSDLRDNDIYKIKKTRFITEEAIKNSATKKIPKQSVLVVSRVGVGKVATNDEEVATSQDFQSFVLNRGNCNYLFLAYLLSRKIRTLLSYNQGTSIKGFTKKDLQELALFFPRVSEQQKIAGFLSKVDIWLENLRIQNSFLKKYKKGMMQKIFSQEIRFKNNDGNDFLDWQEKRLGDLGKTYNGLTNKTAEDFGSGNPFVTYKQIFDKSEIDTNQFGFVKVSEKEKQYKAIFGDIFFTTSSETPLEVGFASVLLSKEHNPYLNSFSFGFRPNNNLTPHYAKYLFRSSVYRREVIKLAQGSTRFNISKVEFSQIKLSIPGVQEQLKISEFLLSIDKLIESKLQKTSSIEILKKSLMQRLFI